MEDLRVRERVAMIKRYADSCLQLTALVRLSVRYCWRGVGRKVTGYVAGRAKFLTYGVDFTCQSVNSFSPADDVSFVFLWNQFSLV